MTKKSARPSTSGPGEKLPLVDKAPRRMYGPQESARTRRLMGGYRVVLTGLLMSMSATVLAQSAPSVARAGAPSPDVVPLDQVPPALREDVRQVLAKPTLSA